MPLVPLQRDLSKLAAQQYILFAHGSLRTPVMGSPFYRDLESGQDQFECIIRNTCRLFVHIVNSFVLLIHQSAKDFLLKQNCEAIPFKIVGRTRLTSKSDSQLTLAVICIWFLQLEELQEKKDISQR